VAGKLCWLDGAKDCGWGENLLTGGSTDFHRLIHSLVFEISEDTLKFSKGKIDDDRVGSGSRFSSSPFGQSSKIIQVVVNASSGGGKSSGSVQRLGLVSSKLEAVGTWCRREVAGPALENRHTAAVQVVIEDDDLFTVWPSTVT